MAGGYRLRRKQNLRQIWGDRCWWCGGVMTSPKYGDQDWEGANSPDAETIEHHLQKEKKSALNIHLRLVHQRCNI